MNNLDIVYKICNLLKYECIKQELDKYLSGFKLDDIKLQFEKYVCTFSNNKDNKILLEVDSNSIYLVKWMDNIIERVNVKNDLILVTQMVDKRKNGVIFSETKKLFSSNPFTNKHLLVDLYEKRYVINKDNVDKMFNYANTKFEDISLMHLLLQIKICDYEDYLKEISSSVTTFSSHISNVTSTITYLNDEDVSSLCDVVDGDDKINRIYDLYKGNINSNGLKFDYTKNILERISKFPYSEFDKLDFIEQYWAKFNGRNLLKKVLEKND